MVCGVILAAGASSRMGRSKALLSIGPAGDCFLTRLGRVLREGGAADVVAVTAGDEPRVDAAAMALDPPLRVLVNPDPSRGQLSSLLVALDVIDRPGVSALLVTPVDVPLVAPATVRALIAAWRRTGAPVVRPARDGQHGHPVLFDRAVFGELRRADVSAGARAVVRAHAGSAIDVPVADPGAFIDIDTPADYERYVGKRESGE